LWSQGLLSPLQLVPEVLCFPPELNLDLLLSSRGQGLNGPLGGLRCFCIPLDFVEKPGEKRCLGLERCWSLPNISSDCSLRFVRSFCWQSSSWRSDSATALMRQCLRSENGRVMDLRFWHLHRGMDLSFVVVSSFFFVTTERTVDVVVVVVIFEEGEDVFNVKVLVFAGGVGVVLIDVAVRGVIKVVVTNNVVERTYVGSWLLTDASFWIRRVFIRIPV
jgi:hypothetical protein